MDGLTWLTKAYNECKDEHDKTQTKDVICKKLFVEHLPHVPTTYIFDKKEEKKKCEPKEVVVKELLARKKSDSDCMHGFPVGLAKQAQQPRQKILLTVHKGLSIYRLA